MHAYNLMPKGVECDKCVAVCSSASAVTRLYFVADDVNYVIFLKRAIL